MRRAYEVVEKIVTLTDLSPVREREREMLELLTYFTASIKATFTVY